MRQKVQNTRIHLTQEPRGDHLTNKCITCTARINGFTMEAWRGDCRLEFSYKPIRKISKVAMYQMDEDFEFDIILKVLPDSNIFEYTLKTEGLSFYYQPLLTKEQIQRGWYQAENVVGSYAMYRKDGKKHHYKYKNGNERNYGTGKFGHIYRPEAIDANGTRVWCDLVINADDNILRIIVPQQFLDTAVYPITIDPIFGNSSNGTNSISTDQYYLRGNFDDRDSVALPESGSLQTLHAYISTIFGESKTFQMHLYEMTDPYEDSQLLETTDTEVFASAGSHLPEWVEFIPSSATPLIAGTKYGIAIQCAQSGMEIYADYIDATSSYNSYIQLSGFTAPDSLGTVTVDPDHYILSLYGIYTVDSIEATFNSDSHIWNEITTAFSSASEIHRPGPGLYNFTAEMLGGSTGVLLSWQAGFSNTMGTGTGKCKITIQYSIDGGLHNIPNTPPYVVRDLVQQQGVSNVLWHSNTPHVNHYYSAWIYYEDSGKWYGPYNPTPTPTPNAIPGSVEPFTKGSLSFSKLETNTKLSTRQDIIVDIIVWLPENQIDRAPAIEAALQAVAPAHTKLNIMYEHYYIAQTTTDHFNAANFDSNVYIVRNGIIINKTPTIDSSYGGDANILGEV